MLHVIEKPSSVILPTAQTNIHPLTTTSTNSSQQCLYSQPRLFVLRSSILLEFSAAHPLSTLATLLAQLRSQRLIKTNLRRLQRFFHRRKNNMFSTILAQTANGPLIYLESMT